MCFDVLEHKLTAHRIGAFLESLYFSKVCISVFDELPRYRGFGYPPTPPSCRKKKTKKQ